MRHSIYFIILIGLFMGTLRASTIGSRPIETAEITSIQIESASAIGAIDGLAGRSLIDTPADQSLSTHPIEITGIAA